MTIKELIEKLQAIENKEAMALVRGYEYDYDGFSSVAVVKVKYLPNNPDWAGKYTLKDGDIDAVIIGGQI